jgi:hypothetical protein
MRVIPPPPQVDFRRLSGIASVDKCRVIFFVGEALILKERDEALKWFDLCGATGGQNDNFIWLVRAGRRSLAR